MAPPPRHRSEEGFSLVELLIALTLGSMLVAVLTTVLTLGLRTYADVRDQLENAARAHTASSRFLSDAQSVEQVRGGPVCTGPEAGQHLLGLSWNLGAEPDDAAQAVFVDWWRQGGEVLRSTCGAVSAGPTVVLRHVQSIGLTCTDSTCSAFWSLAGASGRSDSMDVARRAVPR